MSSLAQQSIFTPKPSGVRLRPPVIPTANGADQQPEHNGVLICMRDPDMARHCAICYAAQGADVCVTDSVTDRAVLAFLDRAALVLFDDALFREQTEIWMLIGKEVKMALVTSRADQDLIFKAERFGVETVACSMLSVRIPS